jgi:hypothetical protein
MATPEEVVDLRSKIGEPENVDPYLDRTLALRIDARGVRLAASDVWLEKAATYAELTDAQEAGSNRNLSSLYKNAIAMHEYFLAEEPAAIVAPSRASRTRRAERV